MDYKEKYEMALERARIWKDKSGMPKDKQGILDDIFPELKESEDEKIRKELITNCRNTRCVTEGGAERIAKWISWLEKQGEKPADKKEPIKIESQQAEIQKWSEEDENNLTDTCVAIRKFYHRNNGAQDLIDWLQSLKNRIVPQPKDWSEDDDKRFNEILSVIDNAGVLTESEYSFLCNIRPQN